MISEVISAFAVVAFAIVAFAIDRYFNILSTSEITQSVVSLYDAHWNDFVRIICEAGSNEWEDIGDCLRYEWHFRQSILEKGQGSKNNCRSLLEKYAEENGKSRAVREKVIGACRDIRIGGRLKEIAAQHGFLIEVNN